MARLLEEIQWGQPILMPAADTAWESEVKRRIGQISEVDRRVAPNPWIRQLCLEVTAYKAREISPRLFNIGAMVTAQENSCRYCYGASRAYMKILGYSENVISRIERDLHVAELEDKERAFIAFCRNLARSRPRPAKTEMDALVAKGFSPLAVKEIAFLIALSCYYNRIGVLSASPPEMNFERMANGFVGRLIGLSAPLIRAIQARKQGQNKAEATDSAILAKGPFGPIVAALAGLPGAILFRSGLDGAFASTVLPRQTKALMFAVVARTLECRRSELEARKLLVAENFDAYEIDTALAALDSPRLSSNDARLLGWARNTVYYQTESIQTETRALGAEIGNEALLEAIGVAALANAVIRLAMLLE